MEYKLLFLSPPLPQNGWSLLHHAMLHGSPEATIALLVDSKADLYERSARYPGEDGTAANDFLAAFELEPGRIPRSLGGTLDSDGSDSCIAMGSSDDRSPGYQNAVQELLNRIGWGCEPQPMTARQFVMLLFDECAHEMDLDAIRHLHPLARPIQLLRFRQASDARRDAKLVFQAASEGRPLELAKRLRLGVLAGGLHIKGQMQGELLLPLEAAQRGGHVECEKVLVQAEKDWKQHSWSKERASQSGEAEEDSDEDDFGF